MFTRFVALLTAGIFLAGMQSATAAAQGQDVIKDGLWTGYNMVFGNSGNGTTPSSAPALPKRNPTAYAALGDSVAAGYGLPQLTNSTATDRRCWRSAQAYPYLVASAKNMTLIHTACSGATVGDLVTRQYQNNYVFGAQLKKAFANGVPGVISITAGANDIAWRTHLLACRDSTCGTQRQTAVSDALITALELKYDAVMTAITIKSSGNPPAVVLTGYYNPVSPACTTVDSRITAAEITWVTERIAALNNALQRVAARYDFVTNAPVNFSGHDLCASDPWIQGFNTRGALHPNTEGQQAIANAVIGKF